MPRRKNVEPPVPENAAQSGEAEKQPKTEANEHQVEPQGQAAEEVKEQQNDQTSQEEGLANAAVEQIEGRKDAQLALEKANEPAPEPPLDPEHPETSAPTHQAVTDSVRNEAAADALAVQAEQADNVKNAFIAETRGERLDTFQPQRVENVRIMVESNDHLDRSGNDVHESDANKIVISDGADEARMIDVQPAGEVDDEFDLGNGIRQTNLK